MDLLVVYMVEAHKVVEIVMKLVVLQYVISMNIQMQVPPLLERN